MNKILKKRRIIVVSLAAVFIAAGSLGYLLLHSPNTTSKNDVSTSNPDNINYSPPSKTTLQQTANHKKDIASQTSKSSQATSSSAKSTSSNAKPIITSSGEYDNNVEVGSRVPNVYEEKGVCTLTLTKGGRSVTAKQNATPNVSEMSCGFITIASSNLSSGNWSAVISYSSVKHKGSSNPVLVAVK